MSTAADRLIPIPTTRMSNDAWKKLVDRFQLPAEARNSIDSAISFYILTGHATYSPSATKKRLREVAIIAAKLGKALKTVAADQLAIQALTHISVKKANVTQAIQERNVSQIIAADISAVEQLALSCLSADQSVKDTRPGAATKSRRLAMFVSLLDEISVKYVGSHLRRDTKGKKTGRDFVRAISDIGGFKLTPGSIDEALKQVVKGRGEIGAQQPR